MTFVLSRLINAGFGGGLALCFPVLLTDEERGGV